MHTPPVVLSIDDSSTNQNLLKMAFEHYQMHFAMDGPSGLAMAKDLKPDIILLDVAMPGMDGFQVCEQLKQSPFPYLAKTPVIFLSVHNGLEDRLNSYRVGAEDYITKPFDINELGYKIDVLLAYRNHMNTLSSQLASASNVAITAITNSGELGVIITFLTDSVACTSSESLAHALFSGLNYYQLTGSLITRLEGQADAFYSNSLRSPLETQLLEAAPKGPRIVASGRRVLFNAERISLLIKDMPLEDPDKTGRLKDHLAILLTTADARLQVIEQDAKARRLRALAIQHIVSRAQASIQQVAHSLKSYNHASKTLVDDICLQLEAALTGLMLPDADEHRLLSLLESIRTRFEAVQDTGAELDTIVSALIQDLSHLK